MMYYTYIYSISMGGARNLKLKSNGGGAKARAQGTIIFLWGDTC